MDIIMHRYIEAINDVRKSLLLFLANSEIRLREHATTHERLVVPPRLSLPCIFSWNFAYLLGFGFYLRLLPRLFFPTGS